MAATKKKTTKRQKTTTSPSARTSGDPTIVNQLQTPITMERTGEFERTLHRIRPEDVPRAIAQLIKLVDILAEWQHEIRLKLEAQGRLNNAVADFLSSQRDTINTQDEVNTFLLDSVETLAGMIAGDDKQQFEWTRHLERAYQASGYTNRATWFAETYTRQAVLVGDYLADCETIVETESGPMTLAEFKEHRP